MTHQPSHLGVTAESADQVSRIGALASEAAPAISAAAAEALLLDIYGIDGEVRPLAQERDHNFHVRTRHADSRGSGHYVLKISHPAEDAANVDFQVAALQHIARSDPGLAVPRVMVTRQNEPIFTLALPDGRTRIGRLFSYLDGTMLCDVMGNARQDRHLGIFLARLGLALRDFDHASEGDADLLWDLRQLARTHPFVPLIRDPSRRALVAGIYEDFATRIAPVLPGLRSQVIHNDMNPDNVVMAANDADTVAGIIDFGDMLHGPLICDVAIGAAYRWSPDEHPLVGAARFVAGYAATVPLQETEIDLLPDLICARLAAAVTIAAWQAEQFPENRAYVMRFNAEFWLSLERIMALAPADRSGFLRHHLAKE